MSRISIAHAIAALLLFAGLSSAQDVPAPVNPEPSKPNRVAFEKLDTDSDGKLSLAEIQARIPKFSQARFTSRDKNADGFLTADEHAAGQEPKTAPNGNAETAKSTKHGPLFQRADKDANGLVTLEEVQSVAPNYTPERFKKLDKDGDGAISASEAPKPKPSEKAATPSATSGLFGRADKDSDSKLTYEELVAVAPKFSKEKFDGFDKNKDGTLSRDEMPGPDAAPGDKFKRADANADGRLSLEEVKAIESKITDQKFSELDTDKDGSLTPAEAAKGRQTGDTAGAILARKADKNKDGKVSFEEMQMTQPKITQEKFNAMDRDKDGSLTEADRVMAEKKPGSDATAEAGSKLMEADADKDGKVTFEEASVAKPGYPREAFDRADRNKDGAISADDSAKTS